jgi:hypothetical protein
MARKKGLSFTACCGSGFALAAVAVAVILIAASFRTLDATTYGLAYDSLWCTIDRTTLYNNGLFFVGPTTVFLTFPKATRDVYDTLPARTRDGLTVGLELSFQYRLQQSADSLAELYMMFGLEYESAFRREARDVLRNAASGFTAFECWRNRTALVVSMQAELDTALSRWYANVEAFQVGRRRQSPHRARHATPRPPPDRVRPPAHPPPPSLPRSCSRLVCPTASRRRSTTWRSRSRRWRPPSSSRASRSSAPRRCLASPTAPPS